MCPDTDEEIRVKTPLARLLVFSPTEGSVVGLFEDLFQIGDGLRSGVTDAPSFVINLLQGDVHGATTDGRNLIGDVVGILDGVEGLGVSLGEVPKRYLGSAAKLADSKILAAAQLAIEGQKALTGSGDPEEGNGYRDSARRLEDTVETLIDAAPKGDRWDGAAAESYAGTNATHRRITSAMSVADQAVADIIATEAGQVQRTRRCLDDASQQLYDFGLATSWMMFIPPLIPGKIAGDLAAASAALATTSASVAVLAKNSLENASRLRSNLHYYESAASDTSGETEGCESGIITQDKDRDRLPSRIGNGGDYSVPEPEVPYQGPPATPYGGPAPTSSGTGTPAGSARGRVASPRPPTPSSGPGRPFPQPAPQPAPRPRGVPEGGASSPQPRPRAPMPNLPTKTEKRSLDG